ncbi:junctional adhesion molecule B isoform X1 [Pantherophis guttatus]|uniref:Junctional adhesion molecule B isoform X1 n=1 Tax=Pantherophis guttatus TaxID=94885 RepID=A0ABM3Z1W6_PANGU|nr:junctional adhesion molecule B isoform X1 [Pantherophis guttatus]
MASCRRLLCWLLFSLLGSLGYYKTYGITVYSDNKRVTAREFEGAYLSCKHNVKKEIGARIEWKMIKGSTVSFVYLNGVFVGNFKGRAEILHSSIHLKNVTRKDSAKYRCEISAPTEQGQGTGEVEISLVVLVPPSAPVCEVPISALSGTVVELRCKESEGVPASKYRWYRNGAILPENTFFWSFRKEKISYTLNTTTGTLLFNPVSKNDTGEYYCEAHNQVGRPKRCPVKRMQVDDLNVSAIIASVVIVVLIMASCGLGVYYAQKKGYFSRTIVPSTELQKVKKISSTPSPLLFKRKSISEDQNLLQKISEMFELFYKKNVKCNKKQLVADFKILLLKGGKSC